MQHVGEKSLKAFHKLQPIMRPANSHAAYRKVLSGVHRRDPCIPYFGMLYKRDDGCRCNYNDHCMYVQEYT